MNNFNLPVNDNFSNLPVVNKKNDNKSVSIVQKVDDTIKDVECYNRYAETDKYDAKIKKKKEGDKKYNEQCKLQNQFNYYFVVYFRTDQEKIDFCKKHNIDQDFVFGEDFEKLITGKGR